MMRVADRLRSRRKTTNDVLTEPLEENRRYEENNYMIDPNPNTDTVHALHGYGEWMHQIEPVPVEDFPRPLGPLVYEGFVPSSSIDASASLGHSDNYGQGLLWPASKLADTPVHQPAVSQYPDLDDPYARYDISLAAEQSDRGFVTEQDYTDFEEPPEDTQDFIPEAVTTGLRRSTRPGRGRKAVARSPKPERRRGRMKGEKRGPREVLDPGEEFNALHARATDAFLDKQDYDTAFQCILQAISINPEIHSAHVLLSEIHFAQGENAKAIAALFSGAHAAPNNTIVWHQLADACLQKSTDDRETSLKQATYCFSRILGIDPKDSDARFQKAAISKELGHYAKALKDLDVLLKDMPHNESVLRHIAEVCLDLGDVTKARVLYEEALDERRSGRNQDEEVFSWAHLTVYVDLVLHDDGMAAAIKTLKEIARWLVGREDEWFWTSVTSDDREWDVEHEPRRSETPAFQHGRFPVELYGTSLPLDIRVKLANLRLAEGRKPEALSHFEWLEPHSRGEGSNVFEYVDLFLQAADSLRTYKEYRQAYVFYDALNSISAYDDAEFWIGIASCAYVCGMKDEAIKYFENAKSTDPQVAEPYIQLSKLYADEGNRAQAIVNARQALVVCENAVGKTQKRKYERKEIREAREEAQAAYRKAYMLTPAPGERRANDPAPSFSRRAREKRRRTQREALSEGLGGLLSERVAQDRRTTRPRIIKRRLTQAQRSKEQREESTRQVYQTLLSTTDSMRAGDDEARSIWMDCAETLVDEFRSHKAFYPAERNRPFRDHEQGTFTRSAQAEDSDDEDAHMGHPEDVPLPSVETSTMSSYFGIAFSSWLDVFLEYALLLANLQYEPSECYTLIIAAQDCIIWYNDPNAMAHIYTCYLVCALALHDEATLFSTALRWLMREFAHCTDVYRLFGVLNFYYPHVADKGGKAGQMLNAKFRVPPNQKFIFRHVVSLDAQLPEDYGVDTHYGPVPAFMRKERREAGFGYLKFQPGVGRTAVPASDAQTSNLTASAAESPSASALGLQYSQTPENAPGHKDVKPTEMETQLLILYGQILYAGGSFPNALSYFYRAMSLDSENPTLLLTMALCYLHQMMKRQCDNRHAYYLQGMALFERYAETRMAWAERTTREHTQGSKDVEGLIDLVRREIEFNRARCWQMVGMVDLAIRAYARMMDMKPLKQEDNINANDAEMDMVDDKNDSDSDGGEKHNDYSREAAYSMALVYASSGDMVTAREITEKWLVIE